MEHKLLLAAVTIIILLVLWFYFKPTQQIGIVIILNGPSASGKSSVQNEFQSLMMPNLWVKHGIDSLFDQPLPDITPENLALWQTKNPIRWIKITKHEDQNNIMTLFVGDQGDKVAYGMNGAIAAYAQNGNNVIMDYIAYKKQWMHDLQKKLKKSKTYFIKINAPLDVLEQREQSRGTSPIGHARSHYDTVHWDIVYDLEIDSSKQNPHEIAQRIKEFLKL